MELWIDYADGGQLARVSAVDQSDSEWSGYGPEKFVVEYQYDDVGRLFRKIVRDNSTDENTVRFEVDYTYNGRGQLIRERIMRYDIATERMIVTQDIQTTFDLGRNPTQIKYYDNEGWALTEIRTYAKGYQLTGFNTVSAGDVTVNTAGSFTYDTNNNLTGTKKLDASRNGTQLMYRAQWTFTFDNKNRMISHTHAGASNVRGNLWYDGMGRVWQRWNDNSSSGAWDASLTRFVYDGSALVQEHQFDVAEVESAWVYTYGYLTYDYLRHASGIRQRESDDQQNYTDRFLLSDGGKLTARIERETSSSVQRMELASSGSRQAAGSEQDVQISNLATPNSYIESYGGTTSPGATQFFDPLQQRGTRHALPGLGRWLSLRGNNAQVYGGNKIAGDPVIPPGFDRPPGGYTWSEPMPYDPGYLEFCKGFSSCCTDAFDAQELELQSMANPPQCCFSENELYNHEDGWFAWCCGPHCIMPDSNEIVDPCENSPWADCGCDCCWKTQEAIRLKGPDIDFIWGGCGQWESKIRSWINSMCDSITNCACRAYRIEKLRPMYFSWDCNTSAI